eukprot:1161549-Pelagomonas_calceolata.AAC.3
MQRLLIEGGSHMHAGYQGKCGLECLAKLSHAFPGYQMAQRPPHCQRRHLGMRHWGQSSTQLAKALGYSSVMPCMHARWLRALHSTKGMQHQRHAVPEAAAVACSTRGSTRGMQHQRPPRWLRALHSTRGMQHQRHAAPEAS